MCIKSKKYLVLLVLVISSFMIVLPVLADTGITTPTERVSLWGDLIDADIYSITYYSAKSSSSITVSSLVCWASQHGTGTLVDARMDAESADGTNRHNASVHGSVGPGETKRFEKDWVNATRGNNVYGIISSDQPAYTYAGVGYDQGYIGWDFYWQPSSYEYHIGY